MHTTPSECVVCKIVLPISGLVACYRYDDEHFKQWQFPVTDTEIQTEGYLKSQTASEESAVFLSLRGNCLKESGRLPEAANCFAQASKLAPTLNACHALLADTEASDPSSVTLKS